MAAPVRGVEALNKAFALADAEMRKGLPAVLKSLAQPIRTGAERRALAEGIGTDWSQFRIGTTRRSVYIAPVERGTRLRPRKRPKFARFLKTTAMEPALNANRQEVEAGVEKLIARIERQFNRG